MKKSLILLLLLGGCATQELRVTEYKVGADALTSGAELVGCRVVFQGSMEGLVVEYTGEKCKVSLP